MNRVICGLLMLLAFISFNNVYADPKVPPKDHKISRVQLDFFWSKTCPHCLAARQHLKKLAQENAWLQVNSFEVTQNPHNAKRFAQYASQYGKNSNSVPAFFFCNQMMIGFSDTIAYRLNNNLNACYKRRMGR